MESEIIKLQERYLEQVQAILDTDLTPNNKLLKMQLEFKKLQSKIEDEVLNYQIEYHLNELPF